MPSRSAICDRPEPLLPPQVHDLAHHRRRGAVRLVVRARGPVEHPGRTFSPVAVGPLLRGLPRHVEALGGAGRSPNPIDDQRASFSRARGVRAALAWVAWDMKASWVSERFLDSSTPHREAFTHLRPQTVSSQDLDQRAWASQLALHGSRSRTTASASSRPSLGRAPAARRPARPGRAAPGRRPRPARAGRGPAPGSPSRSLSSNINRSTVWSSGVSISRAAAGLSPPPADPRRPRGA